MEYVLLGILYILCILDDIVMIGILDYEYKYNFSWVLLGFVKYGLCVNLIKCEFFKKRVSY